MMIFPGLSYVQQENRLYSIEVKAGKRTNSKSAGVFASRYNSPCIVKLGAWNSRTRGRTHFIPLYAAGFINSFLKVQTQQDFGDLSQALK